MLPPITHTHCFRSVKTVVIQLPDELMLYTLCMGGTAATAFFVTMLCAKQLFLLLEVSFIVRSSLTIGKIV
jgi:hypothetical protein